MKKATRRLLTVGAVLAIGACGDTVEVVVPPVEPPVIPPIPPIVIPPPPPVPPVPPPPPPVNQAPQATGQMPAHEVAVGGTSTQNVAGFFSDADGDALTYAASSSNEGVVTVAVEGTVVTLTGVADGRASVTVTASDPDGASAAHAIAVTVGDGDSSNAGPVSTSDIPDHSVRMGGSVTVDASNYFSDADGDELTYTASSSNDEVASVAVEGSTATITGVAVGSAVVTVTASDGSAEASQGFGVTVTEESSVRPATVALFGLRSVTDRSMSINPTNVSGDIAVILDVQPNEETVTGIAITLGDQVIQCRGTSSDMNPVAGIAESGGQIEVDCFFDTDSVMGSCEGMQLNPLYANGEHALGAFLTTSGGETRSVVATQPVTLTNHGFVMISHSAGSSSVVSNDTEGLTVYGGPAVEGNVNSFHACPVAYDGTTVGSLQLSAMLTDTARPDPNPVEGTTATFRRARNAPAYPVDDEAPFTWPMSTASWSGNGGVENQPTVNEHWIVNDGLIKNPDGLDVSGTFRAGGETSMYGPVLFDFRAPRLPTNPAVEIRNLSGSVGGAVTTGTHYSDGSGGTTMRVMVPGVEEDGAHGLNQVIAVGDCTIPANTDTRASTAFVATWDDVGLVSELPENDAAADLSDDGGLDCYFAELQAMHDALGNNTWLGNVRVQTGGSFGVDRNAPEISDVEPDQTYVMSTGTLMFEAEDPDLETGEPGTGFANAAIQRFYSGAWRSDRRIAVGSADYTTGDVVLNIARLPDGGPYAVRGIAQDGATPRNSSVVVFQFTRDTSPPTFTLGAGPGAVSAGSSASISVTASGQIKDANGIEEAILSVWSNNGSLAFCGTGGEETVDMPLAGSRASKVDLENDSKQIDFSQPMTIKRPTGGGGVENLCFHLEVTDTAVDADGDDDAANNLGYSAGSFSINWGIGMTATIDNAMVEEGGTATVMVRLDAQPTGEVKVEARSSDSTAVSVPASPGDTLTFTAENYMTDQSITLTFREDPDNAAGDRVEDGMNEAATITLSGSGGGYDDVSTSVAVTVLDNDPTITVSAHDFTAGEASAADSVTVTATIANAIASTEDGGSARTISVPIAVITDNGGAANGTTVDQSILSLEIMPGMASASDKVSVNALAADGGSVWRVGTQYEQVTATITVKAASNGG